MRLPGSPTLRAVVSRGASSYARPAGVLQAALRLIAATLAAGALAAALGAGSAGAFPVTHECQHPVTTGVEVFNLRHVRLATACGVALRLYRWENENHSRALYGCSPSSAHPVRGYLRRHEFEGWRLSLRPAFTMRRGRASFAVTGTDFPIACN